MRSRHKPPFLQGFDAHSLMSEEKERKQLGLKHLLQIMNITNLLEKL